MNKIYEDCFLNNIGHLQLKQKIHKRDSIVLYVNMKRSSHVSVKLFVKESSRYQCIQ